MWHPNSRYEAFGAKTGGTGTVDNKYLFTGEQYDSNLGDYYLRARYYDSDTGRFTKKDTYEGRLSEPLSLHKYGYAHNNPVNSIDPTGLFTMTEVSAANGIREVLSGMQASSTNFLFSSAEKGSDYSASDFGQDFAKEAGWLALGLLAGAYMPKFVSSLGGGRMWSRAKLTQRWGNPTSDALRKSMVQAQVIQRNASGHAHHIVPGTHNLGDAIEVRSHLAASGVQANDYQNGVLLTTAEHKGLHTKDYYAKVLARLKPIHGKSALHMELELIGQEIKAGNFP